jgi:hypothetical protein
MEVVMADVIKDPRHSNEKLLRVREEIDQMIGWGRIKDRVKELVELCGVNFSLELQGKPPLEVFLNRLFLGNPGTGKTQTFCFDSL